MPNAATRPTCCVTRDVILLHAARFSSEAPETACLRAASDVTHPHCALRCVPESSATPKKVFGQFEPPSQTNKKSTSSGDCKSALKSSIRLYTSANVLRQDNTEALNRDSRRLIRAKEGALTCPRASVELDPHADCAEDAAVGDHAHLGGDHWRVQGAPNLRVRVGVAFEDLRERHAELSVNQ